MARNFLTFAQYAQHRCITQGVVSKAIAEGLSDGERKRHLLQLQVALDRTERYWHLTEFPYEVQLYVLP